MNYQPQYHAPHLLGSSISSNFGYQTQNLYANGFVVETQNLDLYTVQYWYLKIGCDYTEKIPYDLAVAIDSDIPDSGGVTGNLLALDSGGIPAACLNNCCEDYSGNITHANGMFEVDLANPCPATWTSQEYATWALMLDALDSLTYSNGTKLFPITFNYLLHDFFFVRDYITRWSGDCGVNVVSIIEAQTTKCTCDPTGQYGCP